MASSDDAADTSVSTFISTLIPTLVIAIIFYLAFIGIRKKQQRVYEPRNVVETVSPDLKPGESPAGFFGWVSFLLHKPETYIIQQAGVDGYFFIRFLFEFATICLMGCCILWPILFPINATGGNGNEGFNILSYSNVKDKNRFFAQIFLSWVFFGAVLFLIYRELVYYTTFRHALQTTPLYDSLLSSRTLLLTEVPENLLKETELRGFFPTATNVWYARDYTELTKKVKERNKLTSKYEGTLNKTITKAVKIRNKALKKNKEPPLPADDLDKYLKDGKKRPSHKLKFLIGKKVDTLTYCPERLGELNTEVKKDQAQHNANTQIPSVFIEFPTQLELQKAYQAIPYNKELGSSKRFTGLTPDDVIWENLHLTSSKRRVKKIIASTVLTLMIIFWCIPVAVVGAISNINTLIEYAPWLEFINNLPSKLLGLITGLLPVVALAVLMSLIPPFIKKMGKVSGCMTVQQVESYCQAWFYAFNVVQVFLVMALCSSSMSAVPAIVGDPSSLMPLLAEKLPASSNFYIAYFCLQGLTITSGLLLQIVALILSKILGRILDGTPRAKWNRWNTLGQPFWSIIYPNYQLLCVIAFSYAIIAPLILGFAFVTFVFLYCVYMYTLVHVLQPNKTDARGRNYPSALLQLFVGLYLAEICLTAMFVFGKNWAAVALEGIMIGVTALCHIYYKWKFLPLWDIVPVSAIRHAAGDATYQYPMHDQGLKEIKIEGENYWKGGNQLGLTGDHDQQVLPNIHEKDAYLVAGSDSLSNDGTYTQSKITTNSTQPTNRNNALDEETFEGSGIRSNIPSSKPKGSKFARFFKPKLQSFDFVRDNMPQAYFNYIEYNPDFIRNAYEDPVVNDEEPHIWIARDEMGLSEIEKNKALENGVDVSDDNAIYNEKGELIYTGAPPSYEEALKV